METIQTEGPGQPRGAKEYGLVVLKGIAMGAADVVPGVSGGTIAFISGIYQELLLSIRSINLASARLLFQRGPKAFWQAVNGNFLLALVSGIAFSILSLAKLFKYLLEFHPIEVWSFFFGLIVASTVYVAKTVSRWDAPKLLAGLAGAALAYWITIATPTQTPDALWFVGLSGAIAICAMILPGISGSFILLLMGKYIYVLTALTELNLPVIFVFIAGAAIGLLSFSHLLSWLLQRFHDLTVAVLAGFMLGSLNKVWPWKRVVETFTDRHGHVQPLVEANVLPGQYAGDPALLWAIGLSLFGFGLIFALEAIADRIKKNQA